MKIKYYADDGKIFDSEKEALEYEAKVKAQKEKEIKLKEEKDKRWAEVDIAYKKAEDLYKKYMSDYSYPNDNSFVKLFNIFNI